MTSLEWSVMSPCVTFVMQPAELTIISAICTVRIGVGTEWQIEQQNVHLIAESSQGHPRALGGPPRSTSAYLHGCSIQWTHCYAVARSGRRPRRRPRAQCCRPALLSLPLEGCCFVFGSRLQIDPASLLTPYVKLMGNVIDGQAPPSPPGHSTQFI
jgi:hypothetical protein